MSIRFRLVILLCMVSVFETRGATYVSADVGVTKGLDGGLLPAKAVLFGGLRLTADVHPRLFWGTQLDLHYWELQSPDQSYESTDYRFWMVGQTACLEFVVQQSTAAFIRIIPGMGIWLLSAGDNEQKFGTIPLTSISVAAQFQHNNLTATPCVRLLMGDAYSSISVSLGVGLAKMPEVAAEVK